MALIEERGRTGEGEKGRESSAVSPSPLLPLSPSAVLLRAQNVHRILGTGVTANHIL